MNTRHFILLMIIMMVCGCSKPISRQNNISDLNDPIQPAESSDDSSDTYKTQNNDLCLKVSGPFCEVFVADSDCDPRLNENNYNPGDTLYWINRTQYDTIECYYTEQEYLDNHNTDDCSETQDEGRGCIIDDSPECDLWLNEEDCTVVYSRAACDPKLVDMNKSTGDKLPGIWYSGENKMECFYTKNERQKVLNKNRLKCLNNNDMGENICVVK